MTAADLRRRKSRARRAFLASLLWLPLSTGFAQTGEPITLGAVLSLTGPGAGLGQAERNGIQLAERAINRNGGVKGRPLRILIEDDGSKADIAKSKAEELIFGQKVKAIIGPSLTASTGAVAAITNAQQMAQIAITGLGPAIELRYKSLYHVMPPQTLNAQAMLEYTAKALQGKKVGVLHDSGYGQLVMNALQAAGRRPTASSSSRWRSSRSARPTYPPRPPRCAPPTRRWCS